MAKSCARCSRLMEEGYIVDGGDYGSKNVSEWHPGPPDKRWYGLKTEKTLKRAISSWRCTGCGLLENYAL